MSHGCGTQSARTGAGVALKIENPQATESPGGMCLHQNEKNVAHAEALDSNTVLVVR